MRLALATFNDVSVLLFVILYCTQSSVSTLHGQTVSYLAEVVEYEL